MTTLVSGQNEPTGVAVDSSHIYWAEQGVSGSIKEAPLTGGTVTTLASGQIFATGVAVDSSHVHWASQFPGTINEVPLAGGPRPPWPPDRTGRAGWPSIQATSIGTARSLARSMRFPSPAAPRPPWSPD